MAKTPSNSTAVAVVPTSEPIELKAVNGHGRATSLQVAERFGKRHDNVIRAIKSLGCGEEFSLLNFEERDYVDERGKLQPMVEMTRDGFALLAMGFTGPQAMAWKIQFLKAFNQLEQAYIEQIQTNAQLALEASERRAELTHVSLKDKLSYVDAGFKLLCQLKQEHDPEKQQYLYSGIKLFYQTIGEPLPPIEKLVPSEPQIAYTPSDRFDLLERIEALERVRDILVSAMYGLINATERVLMPTPSDPMPEPLGAAIRAIKLAQAQKGGAA
jgi:Rha family phage regulatory protein